MAAGRNSHRNHNRIRKSGTLRSRDGILQDRLVRLWKRLTAERVPPSLDRWLARELKGLDGLARADRLMLGELLTDAVRFAALTLFCEDWRREGWRQEADPHCRLGAWVPLDGAALWPRLRRLAVPAVFFWTFMRKREEGSVLPTIAPPGPDALEVWRAVKTWAPTATDPSTCALWAGLPVSLIPLVAERAALSTWCEEDHLAFLQAHATRPPLWLRLVDERQSPAVHTELADMGFTITAAVGSGLAVVGTKGVYELDCYRKGLVDIQDGASQAIGEAVAAEPGHLIWDCCAGAGGKSLQLAAKLGGDGVVHATDLFEGKLKDLRRRAVRAGTTTVETHLWDGRIVPDFGPVITERGGFDRVLVDAPCSGSGTWRRNPDGRLRFAVDQLPPIVAIQSGLLNLTAEAVRPGGRLVYATCSWLRAENEDVIAGFLDTHPVFDLRSQGIHGNPGADADTTFTAVMQKRTGSGR